MEFDAASTTSSIDIREIVINDQANMTDSTLLKILGQGTGDISVDDVRIENMELNNTYNR